MDFNVWQHGVTTQSMHKTDYAQFSDWFYVWWRPHAAKGFIQNWILKYPGFSLRENGVMRIESCAHQHIPLL